MEGLILSVSPMVLLMEYPAELLLAPVDLLRQLFGPSLPDLFLLSPNDMFNFLLFDLAPSLLVYFVVFPAFIKRYHDLEISAGRFVLAFYLFYG